MKRRRAFAVALALACASVIGACAPNAQSQQARQPGEYLVTLAADAGERTIRNVYGRFGIKTIRELPKNVYLVTVAEDPGPEVMDDLRQGNVLIKAVQPNYRYRTGRSGRAAPSPDPQHPSAPR